MEYFHAFANNTEIALELRLNSISSSSSSSVFQNTNTINNACEQKPASDHQPADLAVVVLPSLTLALSGDDQYSCGGDGGSSLISSNASTTVKKERDDQVAIISEEESAERGVVVENMTSCEEDMDEDGAAAGVNDGCRKKLRLTKSQSGQLEEAFKLHPNLNPQRQKQELARNLKLRPRQVEVWFQNRRARTKLKQTEVDCEYLKKCCKTLTDENQRLRREVQQLKAEKVESQPFYTQLPTATTSLITRCPSCEQVVETDKSPFNMATNKPYFFNSFITSSSSATC